MPDVAARRRCLPTSSLPVGPSAPLSRFARRRSSSCRARRRCGFCRRERRCSGVCTARRAAVRCRRVGPPRGVCVLWLATGEPLGVASQGAPWPAARPLYMDPSTAGRPREVAWRNARAGFLAVARGSWGCAEEPRSRSIDLVCGAGPPHRACALRSRRFVKHNCTSEAHLPGKPPTLLPERGRRDCISRARAHRARAHPTRRAVYLSSAAKTSM